MFLRRIVGVGFLLFLVIFIHLYTKSAASVDPDRYFHLALSRLESVAGTVHSFPQADDVEWTTQFTDKEFLFHWVSRYFYLLGGDAAVGALPLLCSIVVLLSLLLVGASFSAFWPTFFAEITFFFLSPLFYGRLLMLRPHVLAMVCYCILLGAMIRGRPIIAFASAFCFALAYHSFFIPLLLVALAFPFGLVLVPWKRVFFGALLGLTLGILVNPYFPETVQIMFMVVTQATDAKLNQLMESGWELLPLSLGTLLSIYWLHFVVVLGGLTLLWKSPLRKKWRTPQLAPLYYLGAVSLAFLAMLVRSPRASEYLVPTLVLFIAAFWPRVLDFIVLLKDRTWQQRGFFLAPLVLLFFVWGSRAQYEVLYGEIFERLRGMPVTNEVLWGENVVAFRALQRIPASATGKKVLNCEWWLGSYVFYARPDMRFVDANSPEFLWLHNPEKALARVQFKQGQAVDPYAVVVDQFHADYVLCDNPRAAVVLDRDSRFVRLFPKKEDGEITQIKFPFLYAVK